MMLCLPHGPTWDIWFQHNGLYIKAPEKFVDLSRAGVVEEAVYATSLEGGRE